MTSLTYGEYTAEDGTRTGTPLFGEFHRAHLSGNASCRRPCSDADGQDHKRMGGRNARAGSDNDHATRGESRRFVFTRNSFAPNKDSIHDSTDIFAASLARVMEALVGSDRTRARIFEEFVNTLPHDTGSSSSSGG